jgi:hypothetical protein
MRAAEILVEMLLNEAVFGVLYGPNIPPTGYYVTGKDVREMIGKLAQGLGAGQTQQISTYLSALISKGYSLVTTVNGQLTVYDGGNDLTDLPPRTVKLLDLTAATPVTIIRRLGQSAIASTAGEIFGLKMTPAERQARAQEKEQAREQAKHPYTPTPGEERRFQAYVQKRSQFPGLASAPAVSRVQAGAVRRPGP